QYHFYMPGMETRQHDGRITMKDLRVELKGRLPGIPSPGCEAGAQVDDRVYRDLFRAKTIDDAQYLSLIFQRTVRLHISQCPFGWHNCRACQPGKIDHEEGWIMGIENK